MDYRRLIKFGNSSYVVSIPKDWLKKNNLEKGDMIYMNENSNNEIVLTSKIEETGPESLTITLDIDSFDETDIERRVTSKYLAGYDTFILQGEKTLREKQTFIRALLNNLMALEIIEQTKNKIVAKDFLNPSEISFKTIVRRIDTILRSMFEDLQNLSLEDDSSDLLRRDKDINRLAYLSERIVKKCIAYPPLAKRLEMNTSQLLFYREIIQQLELIGDEIKRIGRSILQSGQTAKKLPDYFSIFEKIHKLYLEVMKSIYTHDESLAYLLAREREKVLDMCNAALKRCKDPYLFSAYERLKTTVVLIRNLVRLVYREEGKYMA
ncbi:phosphate uptake regulator PhoU [Candidatus Woesearchaeota archaeon]|nr:phosphate uptake regulator PhoU [Candidatus Woesearchaeota archaeon]MDP1694522.1 phosphate uptake regulator PhoU [Candidatus Woesearchaeota archaeon]